VFSNGTRMEQEAPASPNTSRHHPGKPALQSCVDASRARRAAVYLRASTASRSVCGSNTVYDQDPSVQEQPLLELLRQRGWQLYRIYADRISGSKERRSGLDTLMADARRGKFQVVVVWRFDLITAAAERSAQIPQPQPQTRRGRERVLATRPFGRIREFMGRLRKLSRPRTRGEVSCVYEE